MQKTSLVKEPVNFAKIGEQISHELGAKMIKNHHDKYGYENSFCYTTGKEIIMSMLNQPGCVGIRMIDAVNEFGVETLVYVGIDSNGNNLTELTSVNDMGKLAITEGMVSDKSLVKSAWSIG